MVRTATKQGQCRFYILLRLVIGVVCWNNARISTAPRALSAIRALSRAQVNGQTHFTLWAHPNSHHNDTTTTAQLKQQQHVEQALEILQHSWSLTRNENKVRQALSTCPILVETILIQFNNGTLFSNLQNVRIPIHVRYKLIIQHSLLLSRVFNSNQIQTIPQLFQQELNWTLQEFDVVLEKRNNHNMTWSRSNLRRILYLLQHKIGLTQAQVSTALIKRPQLLTIDSNKIQATLDFFKDELHLDTKDIQGIYRRLPTICTYSISNQLRPSVQFLVELGSDWEGWKHVVSRHPQCMALSVEKVLEPKIKALFKICHLQHSTDVQQLVKAFPPVLWLHANLIQRKVEFLSQQLNLASSNQIRNLLVTFPQLLGLSVEHNLQPKFDFFLKIMTREQLQDFCLYQPSLLAYSLEGRIKPRVQQMQLYEISFAYAPRYIMSLNQEKFQKWLDVHTSDWSVES